MIASTTVTIAIAAAATPIVLVAAIASASHSYQQQLPPIVLWQQLTHNLTTSINTNNHTTASSNMTNANVTNLNATSSNASTTNDTASIVTTMTYPNGTSIALPPGTIQLQQQDPEFARFVKFYNYCQAGQNELLGNVQLGIPPSMTPEGILQQGNCVNLISDGLNSFCGFERYDMVKCDAATDLVNTYLRVNMILLGSQ
jgi:hypothetical protein